MGKILLVDAVEWDPVYPEDHELRSVRGWFERAIGSPENATLEAITLSQDLNGVFERELAGVIVSGSPRSAWDDDPVTHEGLSFVRRVAEKGIPLLGVCYGHQLLARALGGRVNGHASGLQLGNVSVRLTESGAASPLFEGVEPSVDYLCGHADAVLELPPNCRVLAGSERTKYEAFQAGENMFGVQFHPEFTPSVLRFLWGPRIPSWQPKLDFDLGTRLEGLTPVPNGTSNTSEFCAELFGMSAPEATFSFPTPTRVGPGCLAGLADEMVRLGIERPLVVTDPGLRKTRAFDYLRGYLPDNPEPQVFAEVEANPTETNLKAAMDYFRESACDGIIAFGGGSSLDVGKVVGLVAAIPDFKLSCFEGGTRSGRPAPCIAIPTTSGTGSEVGRSSVITDDATHRKTVLFDPALLPGVAFLDAEVTVGLPASLTAATGIDAFTHCLESFTSPVYHPYCDGIALEGLRLIVEWLPVAYRDGTNLEARTHMQVAAAMGAIAFQKDLGATHSMAHPLSSICGVHHGLANALCLVPVMEFNAIRRPGLYRRVGIACGLAESSGDADGAVIDFVRGFIDGLGIERGLAKHGVAEEQIERLAKEASSDGCHLTNPVEVLESDFRDLFRSAL